MQGNWRARRASDLSGRRLLDLDGRRVGALSVLIAPLGIPWSVGCAHLAGVAGKGARAGELCSALARGDEPPRRGEQSRRRVPFPEQDPPATTANPEPNPAYARSNVSGFVPVRPSRCGRRRDPLHRVVVELEVEQREVLLDPLSACWTSGRRSKSRWMCQRSTTCAGVRPTAEAIEVITSSSSTPPGAIGDHASVAIPCDSPYDRTSSFKRYGSSSIWLTAGTVSVSAASFFRWSTWKFDADRARAAVGLELLHHLPRRDVVAVVQSRQRPVDEEQVDVVEAEAAAQSRPSPPERRRACASSCRAST